MKKTAALAGSGAAPPSRPLPTAPSSRLLVSLTLDFSLFIAALCKMNNLVQILPCFLETIQGILPSSVYFSSRILDCTVIGSKHGTYLLSCTARLGRRQKLWIFHPNNNFYEQRIAIMYAKKQNKNVFKSSGPKSVSVIISGWGRVTLVMNYSLLLPLAYKSTFPSVTEWGKKKNRWTIKHFTDQAERNLMRDITLHLFEQKVAT